MILIFRYHDTEHHDKLSIAIDELLIDKQEDIINYHFQQNDLNKDDFTFERIDLKKSMYDLCHSDYVLKLENDIQIIAKALAEITNKEGSDYGFQDACDLADEYANE